MNNLGQAFLEGFYSSGQSLKKAFVENDIRNVTDNLFTGHEYNSNSPKKSYYDNASNTRYRVYRTTDGAIVEDMISGKEFTILEPNSNDLLKGLEDLWAENNNASSDVSITSEASDVYVRTFLTDHGYLKGAEASDKTNDLAGMNVMKAGRIENLVELIKSKMELKKDVAMGRPGEVIPEDMAERIQKKKDAAEAKKLALIHGDPNLKKEINWGDDKKRSNEIKQSVDDEDVEIEKGISSKGPNFGQHKLAHKTVNQVATAPPGTHYGKEAQKHMHSSANPYQKMQTSRQKISMTRRKPFGDNFRNQQSPASYRGFTADESIGGRKSHRKSLGEEYKELFGIDPTKSNRGVTRITVDYSIEKGTDASRGKVFTNKYAPLGEEVSTQRFLTGDTAADTNLNYAVWQKIKKLLDSKQIDPSVGEQISPESRAIGSQIALKKENDVAMVRGEAPYRSLEEFNKFNFPDTFGIASDSNKTAIPTKVGEYGYPVIGRKQ